MVIATGGGSDANKDALLLITFHAWVTLFRDVANVRAPVLQINEAFVLNYDTEMISSYWCDLCVERSIDTSFRLCLSVS